MRELHRWDVSPKQARDIQKSLIPLINLKAPSRQLKTVAAADVHFSPDGKHAVAAVVVLRLPELSIIEQVRVTAKTPLPYIPGLLSFREGPALLAAIKRLRTAPHLFLFDGQGIAHPYQMGLATHMGLWLDRPTIGCAKTPLYGKFRMPAKSKGSYSPIKDRNTGRVLGVVLRTRTDTRPIFVSCGHKIDLKTAREVVLGCSPKYRIPEPLRRAHSLASEQDF